MAFPTRVQTAGLNKKGPEVVALGPDAIFSDFLFFAPLSRLFRFFFFSQPHAGLFVGLGGEVGWPFVFHGSLSRTTPHRFGVHLLVVVLNILPIGVGICPVLAWGGEYRWQPLFGIS